MIRKSIPAQELAAVTTEVAAAILNAGGKQDNGYHVLQCVAAWADTGFDGPLMDWVCEVYR